MTESSYFQLASIKNKNTLDRGELVERISSIEVDSEALSKENRYAILKVYNKNLNKDLRKVISQSKL